MVDPAGFSDSPLAQGLVARSNACFLFHLLSRLKPSPTVWRIESRDTVENLQNHVCRSGLSREILHYRGSSRSYTANLKISAMVSLG